VVYLEERYEQVIRASPQDLFDVVANPERTPEWDQSVKSVTKLAEGPTGRGARYAESHRLLMREHTIELEVAEYEPPLLVAFSTLAGGPPATTRFELAPDPAGGTLVQVTASARVDGVLSVASPLLRRVMRRQLPRMFARLKSYCESQSTDSRGVDLV